MKCIKGKHVARYRRRPVLKVHRISNRKQEQHSETYAQTVEREEETQHRYVLTCMDVSERRPGPAKSAEAIRLPSDALTGSYDFLGGEENYN